MSSSLLPARIALMLALIYTGHSATAQLLENPWELPGSGCIGCQHIICTDYTTDGQPALKAAIEYHYLKNGQLAEMLTEYQFTGKTNEKSISRLSYQYDKDGLITGAHTTYRRQQGPQWQFIYDDVGRLSRRVSLSAPVTAVVEVALIVEQFGYNAEGNLSEHKTFKYYTKDHAELQDHSIFYYDTNNKLEKVVTRHFNQQPVKETQVLFTFDENAKEVQRVYQNLENGRWVPKTRILRSYTKAGKLAQTQAERLDATTGNWHVFERCTATEEKTATSTTNEITQFAKKESELIAALPFPNPTTGKVRLTLKNAGTLRLNNVAGLTLLNQELSAGENEIDLTAFPAGVYTVMITTANQAESHVLIKQ